MQASIRFTNNPYHFSRNCVSQGACRIEVPSLIRPQVIRVIHCVIQQRPSNIVQLNFHFHPFVIRGGYVLYTSRHIRDRINSAGGSNGNSTFIYLKILGGIAPHRTTKFTKLKTGNLTDFPSQLRTKYFNSTRQNKIDKTEQHQDSGKNRSPFGYGSRGRATTGYPYNSLEVGLPLYLDDFPSMSLTLGGHASSGLNIRLGEQKDFALTLEGRYTLAHFTNALGSPGDFSGLSLAVGFGKYF